MFIQQQKHTLKCVSGLFRQQQSVTNGLFRRTFITDFHNSNSTQFNAGLNVFNKLNNKQQQQKKSINVNDNIPNSLLNSPLFCNTNDIFNLFPLNYKPLELNQNKQEESIKLHSIENNDEVMISNNNEIREEKMNESIELSSIIKKRKLKMTKHKQRKLRKRMRSLKKRLGKI